MEGFTFSESYNFGMPKHVYVQLKGNETACKIKASKVEEQHKSNADTLIVKGDDDIPVGKFDANLVAGWWIQED